MTLALRHIDDSLLQRNDLLDGVIKASELTAAEEALGVISRAQLEANRLLDTARTEAHQELQRGRETLEEQLWQYAAKYAQAMQAEWDASLSTLEDRVVTMLGRALCRLVEQEPPEVRLRACVRQIFNEAGAPDAGVLLISGPIDEVVQSLADTLPWPVKSSDELPVGTVRLVAAQGRWECSLDTAIKQLVDAFLTGQDRERNRHG